MIDIANGPAQVRQQALSGLPRAGEFVTAGHHEPIDW